MTRTTFLKASVAATALLVAQGAAMAADAPIYDKGPVVAPVVEAAPMWSWTGFYTGAFAGYSWADVEATHPVTTAGTPYYGTTGGSYDLDDTDGFFGGGQLGYNWQSNQFVFGVEGELGYMGIDGEIVDPIGNSLGFTDLTVHNNGNFYGALTARLGFAMDQFLIYAKGGAAALQASATYLDNCVAGTGCGPNQLWIDNDYEWETGYTVGAGVEWAMNEKWSAKTEYMYYDFGDTDVTGFDATGATYTGNLDRTAHTVKVGVNYHF